MCDGGCGGGNRLIIGEHIYKIVDKKKTLAEYPSRLLAKTALRNIGRGEIVIVKNKDFVPDAQKEVPQVAELPKEPEQKESKK